MRRQAPPRMFISKFSKMSNERSLSSSASWTKTSQVSSAVMNIRSGNMFNIISAALATVKPEVSPVKDSPAESPDVGNIVLKQREDGKRSESPAVAKPGQAATRRDSMGDKARAAAQPKLKQPLKLVDENQVLH